MKHNIFELIDDAIRNNYYRRVIHTQDDHQVVLMNVLPDEDIPLEAHYNVTQIIIIAEGQAHLRITHFGRDNNYILNPGDMFIIPENEWHYVKSNSEENLKLISIYMPPEHSDDLIQVRQPYE